MNKLTSRLMSVIVLLTLTFGCYTNTGASSTPTPVAAVSANTYYVSVSGNDNNPGTQAQPWKTLAKVNGYNFLPGDVIYFERGSIWSGGLIISKSGTAVSPITFRTYGNGEKPIFENPGDGTSDTYAVRINGSYIVIQELLARNAFYSGFYISPDASHNIIRNSEVTNSGIGVAVNGKNNLVTGNYIHDLKMIVNDVGGGGNDYGAVGVEIFNGPNEVSYNRLINCRAPSYDFGYDGGAVEIYLNYGNADGSYFHHNYAEYTNGFIEIHSRDLQYSANNITVSENTIVNGKSFFDIGLPGYGGGHELTSAQNIRLEQNTFVDAVVRPSSEWIGSIFYFHDVTPTASQIYILNNIIYTMNSWWIAKTGNSNGGFTHTNNIYFLNPQRSSLGFNLDLSEKRIDPQFVDITENNLHLKSTSPAIDAGTNLGYTSDFDNNLIPYGAAPDIGAFEFSGINTATSLLVNSVLPTSRSVTAGTTATIFNTVINAGTNAASGITLSMNPAPEGIFVYQQTDCATNAVIGSPNPSLDLAPGGVLCYVLSFTPSATFAATNVHIRAQASNTPSTTLLTGINTWLLRSTSVAGPDIIAQTTTTDFHQVACSGTNAFAVALSNVGAAATGDITAVANTGTATLPVSISISETDPGTGAIIGDHVLQSVGAGENRTVAVFVAFNGCISFDSAVNRIFIEFRDASNNVVGSTNTAVSTNR